ncbi:hypothetical protein KJ840_04785 [Patescibacteria group bacterium]|nr:hypothetical protein [Patescibacteria group bacterium]
MNKSTKIWQGRSFWKNLSNLWGIIAMGFFIIDFFSYHRYSVGTSAVSVIYIGVLGLYVTSKEYYRWKSKEKFESKYFGEIYVVIWTIIMLTFVMVAFISNGLMKIPGEFVTTYISALGIFAISQQSKNFKLRD